MSSHYDHNRKLYKNIFVKNANKYESYQCYYITIDKLKNSCKNRYGEIIGNYILKNANNFDDVNKIENYIRYASKVKSSLIDEFRHAIYYYIFLIGPYEDDFVDYILEEDILRDTVDKKNKDLLFIKKWIPHEEIMDLEEYLNELYNDGIEFLKSRMK